MKRRLILVLAFALMAVGLGIIILYNGVVIAISHEDWPDNTWPGWAYFIRGDVIYFIVALVPFGLGFWLVRRGRLNHQKQH